MKQTTTSKRNTMKNTKHIGYTDALIAMELDTPDPPMLSTLKDLKPVISARHMIFAHAIPKYNSADPLYAAYPHRVLDLHQKEQDRIAEVMQNTVKDYLGSDVAEASSYVVTQGDPLRSIVALCEEQEADLVVIGRSQNKYHEIKAKNLIRNVDADVIIVPDTTHQSPRVILVPIDFSENSLKALKMASAMQQGTEHNIELHIINVFQRPSLMAFELDMTAEQFERQTAINHREGFEKYMNEHFPGWEKEMKGILVQTEGPGISKRILEQAEQISADMIIMGAKGHSPLARLLIGSTTEALLDRNNKYPTIIVR